MCTHIEQVIFKSYPAETKDIMTKPVWPFLNKL